MFQMDDLPATLRFRQLQLQYELSKCSRLPHNKLRGLWGLRGLRPPQVAVYVCMIGLSARACEQVLHGCNFQLFSLRGLNAGVVCTSLHARVLMCSCCMLLTCYSREHASLWAGPGVLPCQPMGTCNPLH